MGTLLVVRSSMLRQTNLRHASPKLLNPKQIHILAVGIRDRIPPALVLLLLAPAIGELLSGSSPPAEYFTPFSLTILTALYGGGALLAREIKIRWRKGVGSLLLLGASYGVVEEGVMVASWFNPNWPDLGMMGVFGRWLGVNWVWAVDLTIYHAIVSITVPVLLVELAYPERRGEPWLGGKWFYAIATVFALDVLFGLFLFSRVTAYSPNPLHILLALIIASAFFIAAKRLRRGWAIKADRPVKRPLYYLLYTFTGSIACIAVFYILPNLIPAQGGPLLIIILGVVLILALIAMLRFDWINSTDLHRLAICVGSLLILTLLAPFQELDKSRTDSPSGMIAVGLAAVALLLLLYWKIKRRERNKTNTIPEVQSKDPIMRLMAPLLECLTRNFYPGIPRRSTRVVVSK
jgi:hypothetical protein